MAPNKKAHPLQADIDALLRAEHGDPFSFLGMHSNADGKIVVRALQLSAEKVEVIDADSGKVLAELKCVDAAGVFEGTIPRRKERFPYRLLVTWNGVSRELEDPYRFPSLMGETDAWLFGEGNHLRPFEFLGAHP
ncbi:MAG TPA: 1,4-alpha-glucan branching enzyme, partial [Candidatus Kapabacteria bacterium]|nr:1,4-alpha-glucan branching enzyme [Candidatus Kapabacteria bacterium]